MNAYYEDGAIHNDYHKELTVGGNVTAEALKQIMAKFFDDDSDSEGCKPVDDAKKSASPAAGRVAEVLFPDKNGEKDVNLTEKMAHAFVNYLKLHHISNEQISTTDGLLNKSVAAFFQYWSGRGYLYSGTPNGASISRFLREDCHLEMKVTQKSYGDYIRKKIIAGHIDVDVEVSVEDYMKSLED
ncbi:hypothetical protein F7D95_10740 [Prevotella copri]|uniref:Uncharacterized protein n=1 Tax=Segatella copri TaxID=165179 RepID=A0AA91A4Z3_9BACT|nr:hypothetical protein [Segatella copri]MQN13270.1 hypothetical protein [Segatella copri]MQO10009.1 hypothetical protein [Segatella copri]